MGKLSTAAYNLAARFASLATAGQFSDALKSIQAPPPSLWERFMNGDQDAAGIVLLAALGALVGLVVLITVVASTLNALFTPRRRRTVVAPTPPRPAADPEKDKYLKDVIALVEKTRNFSGDWLRAEAQRNLDVLLRDAELIYARHAERMLHKKDHDAERNRIATYAADRHGLSNANIYAKVQHAQDLQYDLLRIAQDIVKPRPTVKRKPVQVPPPVPDPDKTEAERRAKARQQELDALEHERQKKQRELEVERVGRQIRDSQTDLRAGSAPADEATGKKTEARRKAEDAAAVALDAEDAAAEAANKKVSLARDKCIRVFQDVDLRAGEKRARILGMLDEFNFKYDILPLAVAEFIEQGFDAEVEQ
jgi:hypothetical protein